MNINNKLPASSNLITWINCKDSISKRLKIKGEYQVRVLTRQNHNFLLSEREKFPEIRRGQFYLREVILYIDLKPVIYARTLVPKKYLRGYWGNIKKLKDKPLANIVFKNKRIKRSKFHFFYPSKSNRLYKIINSFGHHELAIGAVRQSSFSIKAQSVLLTEVFFENINQIKF